MTIIECVDVETISGKFAVAVISDSGQGEYIARYWDAQSDTTVVSESMNSNCLGERSHSDRSDALFLAIRDIEDRAGPVVSVVKHQVPKPASMWPGESGGAEGE